MEKVNIALAQLSCEEGRIEKNLSRLDDVVDKYGHSHDLIVFPETFITGFLSPEVCRTLAEPLNGPIVKHIERQAKKSNASIVVGLYEKEGENLYNTTVLVGPTGLLLSYRKTHLWAGESSAVKAGNYYRSCSWQGTNIGLLICYDIEFPETARAVASMGTELLVLTDGNWDGPVHRLAIKARAQENQMFVAMANRVGQLEETAFCGESVVVDPYGRVIAEAGREEEVLSASIDLSLVQESRQQYHYLKERRVLCNIPSKEIEKGIREITIQ
ncbi:carbon-nitrogen hydrolase family protein [Peribacillus simplex]|uniref:(R)-amidase n=1 Tax=Peribacillus simplex TaxID=1478 RepID=A0A9X8WK56_9BACI|nr:carbon-nitrogen hydrolase family protein [Peribacillus simplex]WHY57641.1 carbon-nitrogen hydrolase family protein [Peribacillus simplex]SIR00165.1 (R)-amidase [Peribacillus simplex]